MEKQKANKTIMSQAFEDLSTETLLIHDRLEPVSLFETCTVTPEGSLSNILPVRDSTWKCSHCQGQFVSFKGLKQHIGKIHNAKKKHSKCPQCDKRFKTKYAVKFHLRQVHQKLTRVRCDSCGIELYNKYSLRAHVKAFHAHDK